MLSNCVRVVSGSALWGLHRAAMGGQQETSNPQGLPQELKCVSCWQDALLHPRLPLLAFLMAASAKGYTLGRTLASACLQIVHDLAVVPVQDKALKGEWVLIIRQWLT